MAEPFRLPLRWSGALPAGDLTPLNCTFGGAAEGWPEIRAGKAEGVQIPKHALWPSVRVLSRGIAEAGPTGAPWVNANGWRIRLAYFQNPTAQVVLHTQPPASVRAASSILAVADAMAYGAAWVVIHTPETWPAVQSALRFFQAHAEWRNWPALAAVTVIADFADPATGECLNLLSRRQIGYGMALPGDVTALAHTRAAVWLSSSPVPWKNYLPWMEAGGTLVHFGSESRAAGKGRLVGRNESWDDPYSAAAGIHLSIGRRTDILRLWNGSSCNTYHQISPDSRRSVVHLLNYAVNRPSHDVTLWLARTWRSARLLTFDSDTPLKPRSANGGIELSLPPVGVYAAIELET